MKVVKASEMAFADENTIKLTGIPSLVLMENAGRTSAEIILKNYKEQQNFVVVAGTGNNGGDGIVIARYLKKYGKDVSVLILSSTRKKLSSDNLKNLEIFETMEGKVLLIDEEKIARFRNEIKNADVVIDAIFGTGFKPPVKGYRGKAIEIINKYGKNIVSIDIPSGLSTDIGEIFEPSIKANITTTFAYPKLAHILYPSALRCGEVYVIDISIDENYLKELKRFIIEGNELMLPKREKDSHKYTYGHTLIIGGGIGKSGAVIMASKSAAYTGSGLVTTIVPQSINQAVENNLIEEMSIPVDDYKGTFGKKAYKEIKEIIKNGKFSSIVIGMGMSVNSNTMKVIEQILKIKLPLVIDADGLNNLSKIDNFEKLLLKRKYPTVLTPHIGEMSRLTGLSTKEILKDMENVAKDFSKKTNTYVVLKSSRTVISTPEGKIFYSIKGNEGMATAGTGDVLAGILGSLINRLPVEEALKTGVYLHGLSGDIAVKRKGVESLQATDLINHIPDTYEQIAYMKSKKELKFYRPLSEI